MVISPEPWPPSPIILLDEPTSALDIAQAGDHEAVESCAMTETILMNLHDLDLARRYSDRYHAGSGDFLSWSVCHASQGNIQSVDFTWRKAYVQAFPAVYDPHRRLLPLLALIVWGCLHGRWLRSNAFAHPLRPCRSSRG